MLCFNLAMFVRTVYMLKKNNALSRRAGINRSTIRRSTVKAPSVKGVSELYLELEQIKSNESACNISVNMFNMV